MRDTPDPTSRLVEWARGRDAVRAVVLTGSRAVPEAGIDELSDYDVILFLTPEAELARRDDWLGTFGPIMVMLKERATHAGQTVPTRLVQYEDATRIDFTLAPVETLRDICEAGKLPDELARGYRFLLDKDGWEGRLPEAAGVAYVPERPAESEYLALAEEFWWESVYVAKYLARGDLLPARYSGECVLRFRCLVRMLEWFVQVERDWSCPVGPVGRGLARLLEPEDRELLETTFAGSDEDENWEALFSATALFRRAGRAVAADLGYEYPDAIDDGVEGHLRRIRQRAGGD